MQSHPDYDFPETPPLTAEQYKVLEALCARAEQLSSAAANVLTAGAPGERPVLEAAVGGWTLRQLPDDPHCLRISIGQAEHFGDQGRYLVFRGDPQRIKTLLRQALMVLEVRF